MAPNANRLIAVLVTAIIASGLSTRAQTASQTGADSLRGVRSIVLFVSADKTLMDAGVDVSAIKTDVEVELRLVGLKIVESSNATTAQISSCSELS